MVPVLRFLITLAVCAASGLLLKRLKVPGGMLVGALIGGALLNVLTPYGYMPYAGRFAAQTAAGAYIGAMFDRNQLRSVRRVWKPYLVIMCFFLAANLTAGFLIWSTGACDLMTALLCCVPGGMSDTPLIAADMGADVGVVAVLQFVRMVTGIAIMPSIISLLVKQEPRPVAAAVVDAADGVAVAVPGAVAAAASDAGEGEVPPSQKPKRGGNNSIDETPSDAGEEVQPSQKSRSGSKSIPLAVCTVVVATVGGALGRAAGIPAGILVGSMLIVIAMNLSYGKAYLPMPLKRLAQILSGAYIGCTLDRESILRLRYLILPAVIILAVYIPTSLLCGWLNARLNRRDLRESMLSATPGGASDMALIAADLGVESMDLMVIQVLRMVSVIIIFPQMVYQLCALLGQLPG